MKKLSKEQAQWLIDKVKYESELIQRRIIPLITDCTEAEFPEFEFNDRDGNDYTVAWANCYKCVVISKCGEAYTTLVIEKELFKKFTDCCNKIVEWIEQNEK